MRWPRRVHANAHLAVCAQACTAGAFTPRRASSGCWCWCCSQQSQKFWIEKLLLQQEDVLLSVERTLSATSAEEKLADSWKKLNNLLMQLRKPLGPALPPF